VVERQNQIIMDMERSMLKAMVMPRWFWGEAVVTAVYLLNRSPTKSVDGRAPYEVWHGVKLSVHHLRSFGCVAHVKQWNKRLAKLEDRSKAWRFYNPNTKRVHVLHDTVFEEDQPWNWSSEGQGALDGDVKPFTVEYIFIRDMCVGTDRASAAAPKMVGEVLRSCVAATPDGEPVACTTGPS
jgi:hypothetical protein